MRLFVCILFLICSNVVWTQDLVNKKVFKGKVTYTRELKYITTSDKPIPTGFLQIEGLRTITYFINSDSVVYVMVQKNDDMLFITKRSQTETISYSNKTNTYRNYSSLKNKHNIKTVRKKKRDKKVINKFNCRLYQDKTNNEDVTDLWVTKDFPYQFPFNYKAAESFAFPLSKDGLKIKSRTFSKITDDLSQMVTRKLISYEWDDSLEVPFVEPSFGKNVEIYEPIEMPKKDIILIDEKARKYAEIEAKNTEGKFVSIESLKGNYTYIDLWATWCKPCLESMPSLSKIYQKYRKKGLQVVSISLDSSSDTDKWKSIIEKESINWTNWIMYDGFYALICQQLGVSAIPHYILLDPEGRIILENAPSPSNLALENLLNKLFDK